jgi:dolichol-phosphate hexosyltransferase
MTINSENDIFDKTSIDSNLKVEIIIPTLNEEKSIADLIHDIKNHKSTIKPSILVIDGGSTDNTQEICKNENVPILQQKTKGKGNAMREAVLHSKADIVVFIDGDGTYLIDDFDSLLKPLLKNECDMVVGSRILGKREEGSISKLNTIGNKLFNKVINFALKSNVTDSLTGYRALKRNVFEDLVLFSTNFEIEVEMTVEALGKGYRLKEIPITYKNRKDSETKLNPLGDGIAIGKTLLFVMLNIRPALFFGIGSIILFGIGFIFGGALLFQRYILLESIYTPYAILTALLLIMAFLVLILGLLSELIVRSRRRIEFVLAKNRSCRFQK